MKRLMVTIVLVAAFCVAAQPAVAEDAANLKGESELAPFQAFEEYMGWMSVEACEMQSQCYGDPPIFWECHLYGGIPDWTCRCYPTMWAC